MIVEWKVWYIRINKANNTVLYDYYLNVKTFTQVFPFTVFAIVADCFPLLSDTKNFLLFSRKGLPSILITESKLFPLFSSQPISSIFFFSRNEISTYFLQLKCEVPTALWKQAKCTLNISAKEFINWRSNAPRAMGSETSQKKKKKKMLFRVKSH